MVTITGDDDGDASLYIGFSSSPCSLHLHLKQMAATQLSGEHRDTLVGKILER